MHPLEAALALLKGALDPLLRGGKRGLPARLGWRGDIRRMDTDEFLLALEPEHLQCAGIAVEKAFLGQQHDRVIGALVDRPESLLALAEPELLLFQPTRLL